jgi:hypothetical protein
MIRYVFDKRRITQNWLKIAFILFFFEFRKASPYILIVFDDKFALTES